MIRNVKAEDVRRITEIYNHFVLNTVVTFEETAVEESGIRGRIEKVTGIGMPWLVAEENGTVAGYAYAGRWNDRAAYRYTAETTIYLAPGAGGKGWGTKLYQRLLADLEALSIHSVVGVIALPNAASVALHEKFGLKKAGQFTEVGYKLDRWVDVGYWQGRLPVALGNTT